jgi:hypothetical protein
MMRERCNEEKNTPILATDTMIPQRKSDVFEKSHDVTKHLGFSSAIHSWREAKAGVVVTGENHSGGGWRGREPLSLSPLLHLAVCRCAKLIALQ